MKSFYSEDEAKEWATKKIGKYGVISADIRGQRCLLSCTGLPFEELVRNKVEDMIREVLNEAELEVDEDRIFYLGAQLETNIEEAITDEFGLKFISPYLEY